MIIVIKLFIAIIRRDRQNVTSESTPSGVIFYELCDFFFNIDFQRSKGGLMFSENDHNFTYAPSEMYLMTKCGKSGIKIVYNYKNKKSIITMGRQNQASESTPSGPLTP